MDLAFVFELLGGTMWGSIFAVWCVVCALFTALAPPHVTSKIPDWIMTVINTCAFNFGHAKNALTTLQGNTYDTESHVKRHLKTD